MAKDLGGKTVLNKRVFRGIMIATSALSLICQSSWQKSFADDGGSGDSGSSSSSGSSAASDFFGTSNSLFPPTAPAGAGSPTAPPASTAGMVGIGGGEKELTPVNPLKGLFQPQPQYPTPGTTIMFPEAVSNNMGKDSDVPGRHPGQAGSVYQNQWKDPYAKEDPDKKVTDVNPLKGLFQQQPQYPSPNKTQMYPEAVPQHLGKDSDVAGRHPGQASETFKSEWKDPYAQGEDPNAKKDKTNYIQGLFQQQPQYPSPNKTQMFPEAVQHNLGSDKDQPGRQPGSVANTYQTAAAASESGLPLEALPGVGSEKKEEAKKEGDEKKEEGKEKKEGEEKKEEKDKEKKEGEEKKEEGKEKKEGEEKKEEKDKEKKEEKDKEKKEEKDKEKKEEKDKEKKEEKDKEKEVKYAPFNPLREAITLMNSGKFEDSIKLLDKEIKKTPAHPQAYYTRAVVHVKMRRYDLAAQDYKEVLKHAPTGPLSELAKAGLAKLHF